MPTDDSIPKPDPQGSPSPSFEERAGERMSSQNDPGVVPHSKSKSNPILAIVARWVLGAAFVYMGMHKVLAPAEFLGLVRQYNLTSNSFALNAIAAALPWFEVFCGLLLLLGVAVRGAALVVFSMLLPFSIVVLRRALAMAATQGLAFCAVKFDCGCGSGEIIICHKLLENSGLMLVCLWLIFGAAQKLSLRYSLKKEAAPAGAAS